jgi:HSP20 family protein
MSFQKVLEDSLSTINMSMNKQLTKMLSASNTFQPDADVFDKEGFLYIVIDMPGVNKKSIEINFKDSNVIVKGEKVQYEVLDKINFYSREIVPGHFERCFELPFVVNNEKSVKTSFRDGVLKIIIDRKLEKNNFFSLKVKD